MTDPHLLTYAVNTEIDSHTGAVYIYVQETSHEPGVNVRVSFDANAVTPEYMMCVVDSIPHVVNNYIEDVVNTLDEGEQS